VAGALASSAQVGPGPTRCADRTRPGTGRALSHQRHPDIRPQQSRGRDRRGTRDVVNNLLDTTNQKTLQHRVQQPLVSARTGSVTSAIERVEATRREAVLEADRLAGSRAGAGLSWRREYRAVSMAGRVRSSGSAPEEGMTMLADIEASLFAAALCPWPIGHGNVEPQQGLKGSLSRAPRPIPRGWPVC